MTTTSSFTFELSSTSSLFGSRELSGRNLLTLKFGEERFSFLTFLATVQALRIEIFPISSDIANLQTGVGGTSTINHTAVNSEVSFVFKRIGDDSKRIHNERHIFQALINEINVLGHASVREHPHIAQLQGICWDISSGIDKPWPILLFEKSDLGDLYKFSKCPDGKAMNPSQRLKLCIDIAIAIRLMHSIGIVHGDIKPHNILVFKEESNSYTARVIDFGYSTCYSDDTHRFHLPISPPWNAPEHDRLAREWTPKEATRADLFSFGLLCFWILFEPYISGQEHLELETLRFKTDLLSHARQFLKNSPPLSEVERKVLDKFFLASLSQIPEERDTSLRILQDIDSQRLKDASHDGIIPNLEHGITSSDFQLGNNILSFYQSDYRVRTHIAERLIDECTSNPRLMPQAAYCYSLGFGIARDEEKAAEMLDTCGEISSLRSIPVDEKPFIRASRLHNLASSVLPSNFADTYTRQNKLNEAEIQLANEQDSLIQIFGFMHPLVGITKRDLADVYTAKGLWNKAEELERDVLRIFRFTGGEAHPKTISSMTALASTLITLGLLNKAKTLLVSSLQLSQEVLGNSHPQTLVAMNHLSLVFAQQSQWEAAQTLQAQVLERCKQVLGEDHLQTLAYNANLAMVLSCQGNWDEAELLQVQVAERGKIVFGEDHPNTITNTSNLALTYLRQGRLEEAKSLQLQVVSKCQEIMGEDHYDTLVNEVTLCCMLEAGQDETAMVLRAKLEQKRKRLLNQGKI